MEGDHSRITRTAGVRPRNALIRNLFSNLRIPLFHFAADIRLPVQLRISKLSHLLHAFHKMREFFELRPLIIGGSDWHIDVNGLLNTRSLTSISPGFCHPLRSASIFCFPSSA